MLDNIALHNHDQVVEEVKQGKKLQGTGDNWDFQIRAHDMRTTNQNKDLHYFASNLIVERVPCEGLSQESPQRDISKVPNSLFLLNDNETRKLREDFKVLVGRVLVKHIESLSFLKSIIPEHITSKYPNEMAQKSTIVPLAIQFKEEKKYDDVVDILCSYENTLEDIYSKAGVITIPEGTKPATTGDTSLSGARSNPSQPGAHVRQDDKQDHMKVVSVPFGGDELTRVRFAGAKDLRRGCHTAKDRFDHCSPFTIEMFHTKMAFVQVMLTYNTNCSIEMLKCLVPVPRYFRASPLKSKSSGNRQVKTISSQDRQVHIAAQCY